MGTAASTSRAPTPDDPHAGELTAELEEMCLPDASKCARTAPSLNPQDACRYAAPTHIPTRRPLSCYLAPASAPTRRHCLPTPARPGIPMRRHSHTLVSLPAQVGATPRALRKAPRHGPGAAPTVAPLRTGDPRA